MKKISNSNRSNSLNILMPWEKSGANLAKPFIVALLAIGVCIGATSASAAGFGLPGGLGGSSSGDSKATVDVDALVNQQKDLMGRFQSAFQNILLAQAKVSTALGLNEQAEKLQSDANFFGGGNIATEDQFKRFIERSQSTQKAIDENLRKNAVLNDASKKHLAAAAPHYVKGVGDGLKLPQDFKKWGESVTSGMKGLTSNPMQAKKLQDGAATGLYVLKSLPELVKAWTEATKGYVSYAKKNGVDTSDVSSKLNM